MKAAVSCQILWLIIVSPIDCTAFVSRSPASLSKFSTTQGVPNCFAAKMPQTLDNEWDVDLYQNQHAFVWKHGSSLIDLLDPQPGERILDVGCGTGELTEDIASQGAIAIGFDADASMVKRAQEQFPNLAFFQAKAEEELTELDDHGGPVDAIFSNAALHWVTDAESAVASMSRSLKPGGRFVAEFGGKGNVQHIVNATIQTMEEKYSCTIQSPWYFPSIAEYSNLLETYGIEVTYARLFDRPTPLENGDSGLNNWLAMFGKNTFFKDIPQQDLDSMLDDINEKLRPHLFDGEQWHADYRRIRIMGIKK